MAGRPVWPGIFPGARLSLDDNTLAEAAKSKLQGGDPIAEYLGDCVDESNDITLDDNTRVVFFFDN